MEININGALLNLNVFEAMKHRLRGTQTAQGMCEVQIV